MTSSSPTPDIGSLSLSSQPSHQRLHDTYDYDGNGGASNNGRNPLYFQTSPSVPVQSQYNPLTLNQSPLKNKTIRGGLPSVCLLLQFHLTRCILIFNLFVYTQQWLDNSTMYPDNRSLSPPNNSDLSSGGGSPPLPNITTPGMPGALGQGADDEIIPTAIVIKNIPFNVKRETLLDIIVSFRLYSQVSRAVVSSNGASHGIVRDAFSMQCMHCSRNVLLVLHVG